MCFGVRAGVLRVVLNSSSSSTGTRTVSTQSLVVYSLQAYTVINSYSRSQIIHERLSRSAARVRDTMCIYALNHPAFR